VTTPSHEVSVTESLAAAAWVVVFFLVQLPFAPGYFFHDDMQLQYLPGSFRVGATVLGGELPTITPSVWAGGALAGEYQYGVFSIFRLGLDVLCRALGLGLQATATVLCLAHLFVLAAGTHRWARVVGVDSRRATVAGFVVGSSGWLVGWGCNWLPALASFAWLPWYLAGLERSAHRQGPARFAEPAVFVYLILAAGWPYTGLMLALVSAWFATREVQRVRRLTAAWPVAAALAVGSMLAAPALLVFLEYARTTMRVTQRGLSAVWVVPLSAWPSLFYPLFVSTWQTSSVPEPHAGRELSSGLWPAAMLVSLRLRSLRRLWAEHASEVLLLIIASALCVLPSLGTMQWSFRWLPLFHLALALTAVRIDSLREPPPPDQPMLRRVLGHPATLSSLVVIGAWALHPPENRSDAAMERMMLLSFLCLLAMWMFAELAVPRTSLIARAFPLTLVIGAQGVNYALLEPSDQMFTWPVDDSMRRPAPFDQRRLYFVLAERLDLFPSVDVTQPGTHMRPGSLPLLAGLRFVNGYSPMHPRGLAEVFGLGGSARINVGTHGDLAPNRFDDLLRTGMAPGEILDRIGVDGLVVPRYGRRKPPIEYLVSKGWKVTETLTSFYLLHRDLPAPEVRCVDSAMQVASAAAAAADALVPEHGLRAHIVSAPALTGPEERFAPCTFGAPVERETSVAVDVAVGPTAPGLIVFRRAWDVGYEASLDSVPLAVAAFEGVALSVRVPAGSHGRLVVRHRPRGLRLGAAIAGLGAATLLGAHLLQRRRVVARRR